MKIKIFGKEFNIGKTKNLWYVPQPEISLKSLKQNIGPSVIMRNHGGSFDPDKNLNNVLAPVRKQRIVQDVQEWRASIAEAEDPVLPYRFRMQIAFMDTVLEGHIRACIQHREKLNLLRKFKFCDKNGKENEKITKFFDKKWFRDLMKYILEAKWYGYSLISLGDYDTVNKSFPEIVLVPRTHISPDRLVVTAVPKTPGGWLFREEPYKSSHLWVNTPDEHGLASCGYGLLYELTYYAIVLRNNMTYAIEYTETFGTPFRQVKTDRLDKDSQDAIADSMDQSGPLGWMITGKDDEIVFHDAGKGAGYKLYGDNEKRAQQIVSKICFGHADALDSTPGKLGATNGEQNPVYEALLSTQQMDGLFISDVINTHFIPMLKNYGIKLPDGIMFDWVNDEEEYEEACVRNDENIKIAQYVSQLKSAGYSVNPEWLEKEMKLVIDEQVEETNEDEEDKKKYINNKVVNLTNEELAGIPRHKFCKCGIDDFTNEWLLGQSDSGPCEMCRTAQQMWNAAIREGRQEDAKQIWEAHMSLNQ